MKYSYFSKIYDKLYNSNKHLKLVDKYLPIPGKNAKVLDVACGTGTFLFGMHEKGWEISGVDLSEEMLEVARKKFDDNQINCNLYCQNMEELKILEKFDLVTCNFDSINYILSIEKIRKVFQNVFDVLKENGKFAFDIVTEYQALTFGSSNEWKVDGYVMKMKSEYNPKNRIKKIRITLNYETEKFSEDHYQKNYDLNEISKVLEETGFEIKVFVDIESKLMEIDNKTTRAYYVVQKITK